MCYLFYIVKKIFSQNKCFNKIFVTFFSGLLICLSLLLIRQNHYISHDLYLFVFSNQQVPILFIVISGACAGGGGGVGDSSPRPSHAVSINLLSD